MGQCEIESAKGPSRHDGGAEGAGGGRPGAGGRQPQNPRGLGNLGAWTARRTMLRDATCTRCCSHNQTWWCRKSGWGPSGVLATAVHRPRLARLRAAAQAGGNEQLGEARGHDAGLCDGLQRKRAGGDDGRRCQADGRGGRAEGVESAKPGGGQAVWTRRKERGRGRGRGREQ